MKKVLFLILLLFFTGCDVTYNLNIDDDFIEDIAINNKVTNYDANSDSELLLNLKTDFPLYNDSKKTNKIYETNLKNDENNFNLSLHGEFKSSNENSNAISYVCPVYSVTKEDGRIIINAAEFDLDSNNIDTLTVNITSNKKVIEHDADSHDGNTYTWVIEHNDDMYEDDVYIVFADNNLFSINKDKPMLNFIIALIIIFIFGLIIYLFVRAKYKFKNSI